MGKYISFGETVDEYDFKVINENDARASAGIMFLLGILSLFSVFLINNLFWVELFSITFIIEFVIRVFINPKYAPYMILASLIVSNQKENWVEAKPKKFAWILGVLLGFIMAFFIVFDFMSPIRLLICVLCLVLLFLESAFGICLGCLLYKKININVNKCAGDVCEIDDRKKKKDYKSKIILLFCFTILFSSIYFYLNNYKYKVSKETMLDIKASKPIKDDCQAPQWAIDMGHEQMWKSHNCK
ncbi:DUF4395 domain-containing protein [Arcobacter peruensis]|uniref:DUF4395 domain-containing protein n=1 Tax=Arcobacter peruensis TaxID=2320140 RepID=UPI000F083EA3|nr:DUF4395 domain-containing protein [Arcobacter peruensis]